MKSPEIIVFRTIITVFHSPFRAGPEQMNWFLLKLIISLTKSIYIIKHTLNGTHKILFFFFVSCDSIFYKKKFMNKTTFSHLLLFSISIASILGMNLFGCKFCEKMIDNSTQCDRKNFDSLLWALVTVLASRKKNVTME